MNELKTKFEEIFKVEIVFFAPVGEFSSYAVVKKPFVEGYHVYQYDLHFYTEFMIYKNLDTLEEAIYKLRLEMSRNESGHFNLDDVEACAQECQNQQSGEMSVFWLCKALTYLRAKTKISVGLVTELGMRVEPEVNKNGFRKIPVSFRDCSQAIPAENVPQALQSLLDNWKSLSADEFYQHFQEIHPFADGNGRTAFLLWNFINGTLFNLQMPPKFNKK